MKSFKYFIFFSIVLFSIAFPNINPSNAGTFTATLGSDGIIHLNADFSGDFDCVPEGHTPVTTIAKTYDCYSVREYGWVAHGERKIACPTKGFTWWWWAGSSGGVYDANGVCVYKSVGPIYAYATEITDKEVEIISPEGRVKKGIEDIVVQYDFKYNDCNTCPEGSCANRQVEVPYAGLQSNLPVRGTVSFPYDFSNKTGVVKIVARACCGGSCRQTEKHVYVEPEDDDCKARVGKPVSVANGTVFTSETDFSLSGVTPINFTRYYNSKSTGKGGFGSKRMHSFDTRAIGWGVTTYKVINADGSIVYYVDNDGDKIYLPELPKGIRSKLVKMPDDSVVREFNDGTKEEFNKYSYLTAIVDRNGNRITFTRDSNNKLIKITDPTGREINITYDTNSRITQITLPDGKAISYTYLSGRLQNVTYPDGSQRLYEYDNSCYYLTGIKNENGNYIEKHTYDSTCRATTSSADGTNEKLTISYISDTQSTVTDSLGRVTTYTIDKSGGKSHVTNISGPGCKKCGQGNVSYTYDDNLNITSMTDGNGNVTTFTYDSNGNVLTKTEAYGTTLQRTTTYTYEPTFNQVTSITDPEGNITYFNYDSKGNLISITDASGATTTLTRNPQGLVTQITDALGNTTNITYDQYGNPSTITDPLGNITSYTYDIMGKPLSITDANGNQTSYTYDQRSRLKEVRDSLNQLTTYTYDLAGNL
ncbi:MAG: RHS repeat protein, partial [Nitrospirae bacterium]|nr:RHS repeat protein [Nitrospirota bacterium]